jgi:ketosteroid isomerase-like protein
MSATTEQGGMATVRRWRETLMAGDLDAAAALMHEDCVVHAPAALPYGGEYRGAAELFAMMAHEHELFEASLVSPVEYLDGAEVVVIRFVGRFEARSTGEFVDAAIVQLYYVRGGKLAELDVYYKDPAAVAALIAHRPDAPRMTTDVEDHTMETAEQLDHDASGQQPSVSARLNHVEFVHRPGESALVIALFESLTCQCYQVDAPPFGRYIVVHMESTPGKNDFFASEAEEEQLALDDALQRALDATGSDLATAYTNYRLMLEQRPYRATHVGVRFPSIAIFDEVLQRLESLRAGELAGRLVIGDIIARTVEEAPPGSGMPVKQLWIWTNVISTGLLPMGQQIELQTYAA